MKQSIFSGKNIFETMQNKQKAIDELDRALDTIAAELGAQHISYLLLKKQYDEERANFQRLERQEYTVREVPDVPFF